jgi:hypothetical protein
MGGQERTQVGWFWMSLFLIMLISKLGSQGSGPAAISLPTCSAQRICQDRSLREAEDLAQRPECGVQGRPPALCVRFLSSTYRCPCSVPTWAVGA